MKTRITGTALGHPINITIEQELNGREAAKFVAEFYDGLITETPGFCSKLEKHLPTLAKALKSLQDVAEKIGSKF